MPNVLAEIERDTDYLFKNVFSGVNKKGGDQCMNNMQCRFKRNVGPIPSGRWYAIPADVDKAGKGWRKTSFRLYALASGSGPADSNAKYSSNYVTFTNPNTKETIQRGGFYIHWGTYSEGCVTFKNINEYNNLKTILLQTPKTTFYNMQAEKKVSASGFLWVSNGFK